MIANADRSGEDRHLQRQRHQQAPRHRGEDHDQSRYVEAVFNGIIIGCLYLPNGDPVPGPKFQYKLEWLQRLHSYAAELLGLGVPVALMGDFNVMPTDLDVYKPERWIDDALFRPEVKQA